jgi:protein TonB
MQMEEISLLRSQPREHPWGWAFCCSFFTHAGVVLALGLYIVTPMPSMDLPEAIKIDLISMPAAPQVQKRIIPQPVVQKSVARPVVEKSVAKPVVAPPIQIPKPIVQKAIKPEPKPEIVLNKESEPIAQEIETAIIELKKTVIAEHEPLGNLQTSELEEILVPSSSETGAGTAQVATTSATDNRLQNYSNLIRERINKVKRYPLMARKAGKQGTVAVEFSVNRQGELLGSNVVNSCGIKALDKAALKALHRASPFAALPADLNSPHTFNLQINFFLDG